MPLRKRGFRDVSRWFCRQRQGLWPAKLMTERKVHCVAFMKAAMPTSKLTRGLLPCCVETIGLALFLQQEHRVQQAQGASAPVQHFQQAAHFLSRSCPSIFPRALLHKACLLPFIASSDRRLYAGRKT